MSERTAQDVFDALDAFFGQGDANAWQLDATKRRVAVVGHTYAPRAFDRSGYRVEPLGRDAILWRGKRIVAALWQGKVVWVCNGHTYDTTAWQRGEDGAKNELLSALLAMRWPRNFADSTTPGEKLLREFRDKHPSRREAS